MAKDDVIYINTDEMQRVDKGPVAALGLAMSLLHEVWWPTKEPFTYDEAALFEKLRGSTRDLTLEQLHQLRGDAAKFFHVLPDGRWAPSTRFFSLTPEQAPGAHL